MNSFVKIEPAKRIEVVEEYYFSKKLKEIAAMNQEGKDIINLGIGSPDLPPSPQTIEALCNSATQNTSHGYQSYIGITELRNAFARWYSRFYGVELNPTNEILPLMGSKEGIMHISMALLNPGDSVLIPNPGYPTYSSVAKLVGANIINYDLDSTNNWQPNFEELEAADKRGDISLDEVKLMWCNYPNMPTGAPATMELFERLVAFGLKHNIVICHDNPYSFILTDKQLSILSVEGAKDICIELNSLSKSSNMPGWRIGMIGSNPQFIEWILRVKSNMDSGMFKSMQIAAVEALDAPKEWYNNMNRVYRSRRAIALEIMNEIGAEVDSTQVGMFLWGKTQEPAKEIADRVLYEKGVFLTPGFIFGTNGENFIRISLCTNSERLQEALTRIKEQK